MKYESYLNNLTSYSMCDLTIPHRLTNRPIMLGYLTRLAQPELFLIVQTAEQKEFFTNESHQSGYLIIGQQDICKIINTICSHLQTEGTTSCVADTTGAAPAVSLIPLVQHQCVADTLGAAPAVLLIPLVQHQLCC